MNKIFKITTIIMILAISMFTLGCESQEEKFDRAAQKYINMEQKIINTVNSASQTPEGAKKVLKAIEAYRTESEPLLKEMDKIAKGNPKLEEKMKKHWANHKSNINGMKNFEPILKRKAGIE